jgi:hypothetical protein
MEFSSIHDCYAESGRPQGLLEEYSLLPRKVVRVVGKALV